MDGFLAIYSRSVIRDEEEIERVCAAALAKEDIFSDKNGRTAMDIDHPYYSLISKMIEKFEAWEHNFNVSKTDQLRIECNTLYNELYRDVGIGGDEDAYECMANLINRYDHIIGKYLSPSLDINYHLLSKPLQP